MMERDPPFFWHLVNELQNRIPSEEITNDAQALSFMEFQKKASLYELSRRHMI